MPRVALDLEGVLLCTYYCMVLFIFLLCKSTGRFFFSKCQFGFIILFCILPSNIFVVLSIGNRRIFPLWSVRLSPTAGKTGSKDGFYLYFVVKTDILKAHSSCDSFVSP